MSEYRFAAEPFIKIRNALANVTDPKDATRHAETLRHGARVLGKLGKTRERFDKYTKNGRRHFLKSSIEFAWQQPTEIDDTSLFSYVDMERMRLFRLAAGYGTKIDLARVKRLSERLGPEP